MISSTRCLDINATPEAVWAVLGRYMNIDKFAPQIASVEALTDGPDRVGSRRRCVFQDGSSVVEEVTFWQEGRCYNVRLSDMGSMPLNEADAQLFIEPTSDGRARVNWTVRYRVKFGPLGWLLGQTMMKMMMGKIIAGNLKGLADKVAADAGPLAARTA